MEPIKSINEYLGFPKDTRLLIINGDDLGNSASANAAIFEAYHDGILTSMTLMAPCPWARDAMKYLKEHPEVPFGVHLTTTSEFETYRWGPLTSKDKVPSLLDGDDCFYKDIPGFFKHASEEDVRIEFSAQIQMVLDAGLKPTHLDSHMGNYHLKEEFFLIARELACENELPPIAGRADS